MVSVYEAVTLALNFGEFTLAVLGVFIAILTLYLTKKK